MKNARLVALDALLRISMDEGYSNLVLDGALQKAGLDARDAGFASALFYGVLERKITLDYQIAGYSKTPLSKLSPPVLEILRLGFYQLLYLTKVPQSAAVNECVNLTKLKKQGRASGFVNGILRSFLRNGCELKLPDEKDPQYLSVKYACPGWMIGLWTDAYGKEKAHGILNSLAGRPPLYVRVNTLKISRAELIKRLLETGVQAREITGLPNALELSVTGTLAQNPCYLEGLFHVQDLASQLCCDAVEPKPGERVIDVCAAPGGKSFTMAQMMENKGELLSFDLYDAKVRLLEAGARRLGVTNLRAGKRDASKPEKALEPAQKVLCDAPCSGLGIIRRKPEIREKSKNLLDSLPDLQYLILCKSAKLTAAQGVLFYSTCTLNPAENNQIADRFLKEHPDFSPQPLKLPALVTRNSFEPENQATLFPSPDGTDGFFLSAFRRMR